MKCSISKQLKNLSQNPGIYIFKDASGRILYVGKATNLKSRVASYFNDSRKEDRPVMSILGKVSSIETEETDSALEALILEANWIKKYQPKYNVDLKDDKSFSHLVITREEFPRVLIVRESDFSKQGKEIKSGKIKIKIADSFGPYTSKKQLETALKIVRKIFPFHSRKEKSEKGCLDFQIGLCPGPYAKAISREDYRKNIRNIRMIFSGKKKSLIGKLEKEMEVFSKDQEFEKAADARNRIFSLKHIRDVALIAKEEKILQPTDQNLQLRIEAYDISNISGSQAVGSMVVFSGSEESILPEKGEYRKFRIKSVSGINDVGMMAEMLFRRFRNNWPKPDLILLDGGKGHLNMAEKILKELGVRVSLVGVAKGPTRKIVDFKFIFSKKFPLSIGPESLFRDKNIIGRIMEEAHRFAIGYHRKVRKDDFLKR